MSKKIGRNDPCWCGSGKKFKKCHLDRENQPPVNLWETDKRLREAFGARYCSAPKSLKAECTGSIVKAHTVPKSMSLKKLARNGHVYGFIPSIMKLDKNKGILVPELIGINRASTFTGFCGKHDKDLFSPVEDSVFAGTIQQCFLMGYRSVAR